MRHERFLFQIRSQCAALRSAAIEAGPEAEVPTCPQWTVSRLVRHIARVHSWVRATVRDPSGRDIEPASPPQRWDDLVAWWDEERAALLDDLADPARPAWLPFETPRTASAWARRQAHEAAIHRLDTEHARAGGADPNAVAGVAFDPEFAVDGIDEFSRWILPYAAKSKPSPHSGAVLLRATDTGHTWTVRVAPGATPEFEVSGKAGDVTIEGTADSVYRRLWGRPSSASVTGEEKLLDSLVTP
jgi:uncharacterized protein (TIGR03083 family)